MKIASTNSQIQRAYSDSNLNQTISSKKLSFQEISDKINGGLNQKQNAQQNSKQASSENGELISDKERNFFKSLFPERSDSIDKHVLFNRNGKVSQAYVSKGAIFDSRA